MLHLGKKLKRKSLEMTSELLVYLQSIHCNSVGTEGVGSGAVHEVCEAWGAKMHFLTASELWLGLRKEL